MFNKVVKFFVNLMQKYLPNPFVIAWIITLLVAVMAMFINHKTPMEIINYWGKGFFDILAFAMQMTMILVSGYALASAEIVRKFLRYLAHIPRTPKQTVLFVGFVSMLLYWFNWGLGLVAGGLLAREVAKQHRDVDFRVLVTAAFSGIIITHGGLSASVPLIINTPGHFLEKQIGLVPLTKTIFSHQSLFITITLAIVIPIVVMMMHPNPKNGDAVVVGPALLEEENSLRESEVVKEKQIADKIDQSKILNYILGLTGLLYLGYYFMTIGFNLNVNIMIFIFIVLGVITHGSLVEYSKAFSVGAGTAGGIILQFPFYAGIMGIMQGSGLVLVVSDWFLHLSTAGTFELFSYFSSQIISMFIPSAGGHWVVQAPFMIPAAATLGVEPWKVAMGVAWGESIWNIVCPFWALPLIAITKIRLSDLIGYAIPLWIIGNVVVVAGILLIH